MGIVPLQLSRKLSRRRLFIPSSDDMVRSMSALRVRVWTWGLRTVINGMTTAMLMDGVAIFFDNLVTLLLLEGY